MVIERRKPQIFVGQGAELTKRIGHVDDASLHLRQQCLQGCLIHDRAFSPLASRSMRSPTACRQDFSANNTALTSWTIGMSTS